MYTGHSIVLLLSHGHNKMTKLWFQPSAVSLKGKFSVGRRDGKQTLWLGQFLDFTDCLQLSLKHAFSRGQYLPKGAKLVPGG